MLIDKVLLLLIFSKDDGKKSKEGHVWRSVQPCLSFDDSALPPPDLQALFRLSRYSLETLVA